MVFKNLYVLVFWMKVALALEGLIAEIVSASPIFPLCCISALRTPSIPVVMQYLK